MIEVTDQELLKIAKDAGFIPAIIATDKIITDPSFRKFCEEDLCGKYGANYSCPPDCGTVEEVRQWLMSYERALVLQTIWDIGSYENKPAILEAKRAHNAAVLRLTERLRRDGMNGSCLGYGGCPLCDPCKKVEGLPCAHPDKKISCMSAYCIDVAKLAGTCGLEFAWDPERLYLFGAFVFSKEA